MKYGVKAIYTYSVGQTGKKIYEESILLVEAMSFDEAYEKASAYARDYCFDYTNVDGELVKTELCELLDCFLVYDDDSVQEVYSTYFENKTCLCEQDFYQAITDKCSVEDVHCLRNKDFNQDN